MLVPAIRLVLTVGLGLLFASPLLAQPTVGHFSHVEGSVTRLHRFAPASARNGLVLLAGDQVHVAMGRAEITLTDGSALQLDEHTRVALHAVDRFQVLDGRVFVQSSGAGPLIVEASGRRLHVAPGSAAEVTATNSDLLVRVVDGDARIESSWGSEAVAATQSAFVSGPTGRPFVSPWVPPQHDAFHQWAGGRMVVLVPPPAFLPYAHPTYRQQEYLRVLRHQRFERRRHDGFTRGDHPAQTERRGGDRPAEAERRAAIVRPRPSGAAANGVMMRAAVSRRGAVTAASAMTTPAFARELRRGRPRSVNHVVRRRSRQRRLAGPRQLLVWWPVRDEDCHSPSRRHCRAVCDRGAARHAERRAVRVLGRPSRSQRAGQLLTEHHHSRAR